MAHLLFFLGFTCRSLLPFLRNIKAGLRHSVEAGEAAVARRSANDLKDHIQKVNKMIVDFNEGKLIPNEGMDGTGK